MRWIKNGRVRHELDEGDLDLVRRTTLCHGAAEIFTVLDSHEMCVMQLTSMITSPPKQRLDRNTVESEEDEWGDVVHRNVITGDTVVDAYTDETPCVSRAIRSFLIDLNDNLNNEDRQRLVDVIPEIIDTCPVRLETRTAARGFEYEFEVSDPTAAYCQAERQRSRLLDEARYYDTLDEKLDAVRQAAAIPVA